jgi:mycoredoxin
MSEIATADWRKAMLVVYSAFWCPHCIKTEKYLREKGVPFESVNIETAPKEVVDKVVAVNGGVEWVVPTMEYQGKWRPGKVFRPADIDKDLKAMGVPGF